MVTFGIRLHQARIKASLTLEALSVRIGGLVTKQALSKYEKGSANPSSAVVLALAEALGVEPEYFNRPVTFDASNLQLSFRKKSTLGAKDILKLRIDIQEMVERYLELEQLLAVSQPKPAPMDAHDLSTPEEMAAYAKELRREWGLGNEPIASVPDLLASKGVKVIFTDGPDGFSGVSAVINDCHYVIIINRKEYHTERRRLTAFHEYCHLRFNNCFSTALTQREKENLCNAFANEMLLPSEILNERLGQKKTIPLVDLAAIDETYGISIDAIVYKLKSLGIISEQRHRSFCIRKNTNTDLKEWVEKSRYMENYTDRIEAMVYEALSQDVITSDKAASYLGISVSEVEDRKGI